MATPIKIKRSAVPGKRPQVSDLQTGELALNTYDAELVTVRDRFTQTGIATEIVRIGAGATVTNIIYVTKDGNDNNTGLKLGDAKGTIKGAIGIASDGDVVKVSAGVYVEDNPIAIPKQVSLVGDSLREVTITPQNADKDLFHVSPGNMLQELTFSGTVNEGISAVAFDPDKVQYNPQSPYIRFCTNKLTNSIGMKVDGSKSIGPFKSMVTDSYTQYNSNGIGVSITNDGYAQIVSMFTMNLDVGIAAHSGGQCDVTNSNSSFGNYGMISDGVGSKKYAGIITASALAASDEFVVDISTQPVSISTALYDGTSGILTATTYMPHGLEVGLGITLSKLGFTCGYGNYEHTYVSGTVSGIERRNAVGSLTGTAYTASSSTTYNPNTGDLVIDLGTSHSCVAAGILTTSTASYTPTSGLLSITTDSIHDLDTGNYVKIATDSFKFKCSRDGNVSEHNYPRITDPIYNKWLPITKVDSDTFTIDVGTSEDYSHVFVSATAGNIKTASHNIGIVTDGITFTCSKDGHATQHSYPRTTDPAHNAILGVEAIDGNTITVNVGVATHDIFPSGINGYIFDVKEVVGVNTFTAYVGINTHPHTYVSGGSVEVDVVRPYDGQVVYFDTLYKNVDSIKVGSAGTGYSKAPTITISDPSESWGIKATAVATVKNGSVTGIDMVSNGRGYTTSPTVVISDPDSGSNTATAELTTVPDYYSIIKSTPVTNGISTITVDQNIPYAVGVGSTVPFFKQSRIIASSHSFEYIGTGVDIVNSLPSRGAVPIQENEIADRNGGLTIFTSTDQTGNFRIGDGVVINQQTGTVTGDSYSKSLFSTMTPFILALGGD